MRDCDLKYSYLIFDTECGNGISIHFTTLHVLHCMPNRCTWTSYNHSQTLHSSNCIGSSSGFSHSIHRFSIKNEKLRDEKRFALYHCNCALASEIIIAIAGRQPHEWWNKNVEKASRWIHYSMVSSIVSHCCIGCTVNSAESLVPYPVHLHWFPCISLAQIPHRHRHGNEYWKNFLLHFVNCPQTRKPFGSYIRSMELQAEREQCCPAAPRCENSLKISK